MYHPKYSYCFGIGTNWKEEGKKAKYRIGGEWTCIFSYHLRLDGCFLSIERLHAWEAGSIASSGIA